MKEYDCGFTKDYYYSIGSGVHMGETAEDAVKREVFEETGAAYDIYLCREHVGIEHIVTDERSR